MTKRFKEDPNGDWELDLTWMPPTPQTEFKSCIIRRVEEPRE